MDNSKYWIEKAQEEFPEWFDWGRDAKEAWNEKFNSVKDFIKKHKRLPVQNAKDTDERLLGKWCARQRSAKKGKAYGSIMTPERIKFLESIKGWKWEIFEESWDKKFNDIKTFIKKYKRLPVQNAKDVEEKKLGKWCQHQKAAKIGKKGGYAMTPEREKLLESLDGWKWETDLEEIWDEKFHALKMFVKKNKRFPVQNAKDAEEKKLGKWCQHQKAAQRGKNRKGSGYAMTSERIKLLESIEGWKWETFEETWDKKFNSVKDFIKKHKRLPVQNAKDTDERFLGKWCTHQKAAQRGKKGEYTMTPERGKLLESLDGWKWESYDESWDKKFNSVKEFVNKNKKFPTSYSKDAIEKKLGKWCQHQKSAQKGKNRKGSGYAMTPERIKLLESIPGWLWSK